jgi:hypothetical protein
MRIMVMNGELGWIEIYKDWQYMRSVYEQEQQALDEKMQQFLEAKGPAPNRQSLDKLRDLGQQLEAKRIAVDDFIEAHAPEEPARTTPLPPPDASLDHS